MWVVVGAERKREGAGTWVLREVLKFWFPSGGFSLWEEVATWGGSVMCWRGVWKLEREGRAGRDRGRKNRGGWGARRLCVGGPGTQSVKKIFTVWASRPLPRGGVGGGAPLYGLGPG